MYTIKNTIQSVIEQRNELVEYIVIDGCSTDSSIEIIRKYDKYIPYWVSEPDAGIYDAMNKAINKASGEWLYFLGADDILIPNIIDQVIRLLDGNFVMIYGDVELDDGKNISSFMNRRTLLQNTVHHQGAFYNKSLFDDFRYDSQLRILSDYELNLKIFIERLPIKKIPLTIARCGKDGASSNLDVSLEETNIIRSRFIGNGILNKSLSFVLSIYYGQKQMRKYFFSK